MPHLRRALPECQLLDQLCSSQTSLAHGHVLGILLLTDTLNPHGLSLAPEQFPRSLAAGQSSQATSSSAQTQGLGYPITSHSTTYTACHKHPLCSWSPHIPRDTQARVHSCCTLQGWEKLGKHRRLIKPHQLSLRFTRRRTPCQCQKCLPGQWDHREPVGMGLVQQSDNCLCGRVGLLQTAGIWHSPALPHVLPELAAATPLKAPAPAEPPRGHRELCQTLTADQKLNSGTTSFLLQIPEQMKHHNFQHAGSSGAGGPSGMWQSQTQQETPGSHPPGLTGTGQHHPQLQDHTGLGHSDSRRTLPNLWFN